MKLKPQNPTPMPEPKAPISNKEILEALTGIMSAVESIEARRLGGSTRNIYIQNAWERLNELKRRL